MTSDLIENGKSINGGWSKAQLEELGVSWPPQKGWRKSVESAQLESNSAENFLSLKNKHLVAKAK